MKKVQLDIEMIGYVVIYDVGSTAIAATLGSRDDLPEHLMNCGFNGLCIDGDNPVDIVENLEAYPNRSAAFGSNYAEVLQEIGKILDTYAKEKSKK